MLDQPPDKPKTPHHAGHRERLRERARGAGIHHLPDYELLELFLFRSQPQGDVNPSPRPCWPGSVRWRRSWPPRSRT